MMALRIPLAEAKDLSLPGRRSREVLSGRSGADSSLRLVDIAVPEPGAPPRKPHCHPDSEELIHVLAGKGVTWVDGADFTMNPGDTIRIAPGEWHVTRNVGKEALSLLCFFPVPDFTTLNKAEGSDDT